MKRYGFGQELQALRKKRKLTGTAAADLAKFSQSKLSKIESGILMPAVADVEALCEAYGVSLRQKRALLDFLRLIKTEYSSWRIECRLGMAPKQQEVEDQEKAAAVICSFQHVVIPGLLQLPAYAEQILDLSNVTGQADVQAAVAGRLKRQALLYDKKKSFFFLITEAALYSRFCAADLVEQQLQHLCVLQQSLANVTIGVLPNAARLPQIPQNAFVSYDNRRVDIEASSGLITLSDQRDIQLYARMFKEFLACALQGQKACRFIAKCAELLRTFDDATTPA